MKVLSKETRQLPYGNGQVAVVEVDGARLHFSRYDNEQRWLADAAFSAKGMPIFCHGAGSRCCMKQAANEKVEALLNSSN